MWSSTALGLCPLSRLAISPGPNLSPSLLRQSRCTILMITLLPLHPHYSNGRFSSVAVPGLGSKTLVAIPDTAFSLPHGLFLDVTAYLHRKELPELSGEDDGKDLLR